MNKTPVTMALFLIATIFASAGTDQGIRFEEGLSWQEAQAKAKAANKPIFIDCFATWCGPCKAMDQRVYVDPQVGDYFNEHFICLRLQMDETKHDSEAVVARRADARTLADTYKVNVYPTFLFFSAEGMPMHKAVGFRQPTDFIQLARDAFNPAKQYYTRLQHYLAEKDYSMGLGFLKEVQAVDGDKAAHAMTLDYIDHHLADLPARELATSENMEFLTDFQSANPAAKALDSSGRIFQVLEQETQKKENTDASWELARWFVDAVIASEEIAPKLPNAAGHGREPAQGAPDWGQLSSDIEKKYPSAQARRVICFAQLDWYAHRHDYNAAAQAWFDFVDLPGVRVKGGFVDSPVYLNRNIFDLVFENCTAPELLGKAIKIERTILDATDSGSSDWYNYADTLANLLYKAGHVQEGIELETKAAEKAETLNTQSGATAPQPWGKIFRERVEKMTRGIPTWDDAAASTPAR